MDSDPQYQDVDKQHYQKEQKHQQQFESNQPIFYEQDQEYEPSQQYSKPKTHNKHKEVISRLSVMNLQIGDDMPTDIKIQITGTQQRGNPLNKYTVYIIHGSDKNGQINVCRRFNQFHQMRVAMVKRWPGCFIPSIPSKNFIKKNDTDFVVLRQRYLNDFLKKVAKLSYLYYSQEFQALIRSKQQDISTIFSQWPNPTLQEIINRYRQCFSQLAGKQINQETNLKITSFYAVIQKNMTNLQKYRQIAKMTALSRDKMDKNYSSFFSYIFPTYEKISLYQYSQGKQEDMLYMNPSQAKLAQHASIVTQVTKKNPYWLLYDLIKNQQRDGRAFLQALGILGNLESKKSSIQVKIRDNQKAIIDITQGKKTFLSITSRGSNQQIKYKLQMQNQQLKKQKDNLLVLTDIISALIAYIQIDKYKWSKISFYNNTLRKIGAYQINMVQNLGEVWLSTKQALKKFK